MNGSSGLENVGHRIGEWLNELKSILKPQLKSSEAL